MGKFSDNPFSYCLDKLYQCWNKETFGKDLKLIRWQVQAEEKPLIETFYAIEASEEGITPDIFLKFTSNFESGHTYSRSLDEELKSLWEQEKTSGSTPDCEMAWCYQSNLIGGKDTFFQNLSLLGKTLCIEGRVIIYLAPGEINKDKEQEYAFWLINTVKLQMSEGFCLMVIDNDVISKVKKTSLNIFKEMVILRPELNIKETVLHTFSNNASEDLNTKFWNSFIKMTCAVSERSHIKVLNCGGEILSLIENPSWAAVRASIYMIMANTCSNALRFSKAFAGYKSAIAEAENAGAIACLDDLKLKALSIVGIANIYLIKKNYGQAALAYKEAGAIELQTEAYMCAMESYKMAGLCYQKMGIRIFAIECYRKAFEVGQRLDLKQTNNATFIFVGKQLASITTRPDEKIATRRKMAELIGSDWEIKYQQLKQA